MRQQAQVNPQMLVLAREFRGISQTALAKETGVTQSAIAHIEIGNSASVSDEKIKRIATALNFPENFFYSSESRLGFGSSSYFYRKKFTKAADRDYCNGVVNLMRMHLTEMLKSVEIEPSLVLPKMKSSDDLPPVEIARRLRAAWHLASDSPIENLTHLVEKTGVVIIESPLGTNSIDGTSLSLNNLPPIIFMNADLSPDRYRFTLAHELGHLVMHDTPIETQEDEADAFASELLLPTESFHTSLLTITGGRQAKLADLFRLKPYWKVSIASMVMKIKHTGNERNAHSLQIRLSMNGYRQSEPQSFAKEKPRLFRKIFEASTGSFPNIDAVAAQMFNLFKDDFRRLYGSFLPPERPVLRLVV